MKSVDDRTLCWCYTTGRDVAAVAPADRELLRYDIWTNLAHAVMLSEIDPPVLTSDEVTAIKSALNALDDAAADDNYIINFGRPGQPGAVEDVHYFVEHYVREHAGNATGNKLHTARSRNDQVTTDLRLLVRDKTVFFAGEVLGLCVELADRARKHAAMVMPGFTHHQHGAVSTLGFLWAAHAEALGRDVERLSAVFALADRCPLGAVMSFGTSWPIDRARTAALLGFEAVQVNNLDAVSSRGEIEASFVAALAQLMNHLSTLGQDLLLMTTEEFGFLRVADALTTGSSVMPQKRNLDFAEATKAKAAVVAGHLQAILGITRGNLSGYNRDTQWTKTSLLDAIRECVLAPRVFAAAVATLTVDDAHETAMLDQCLRGFLNAVDVADYLAAAKGVPFRVAHGVVKEAVNACRASTPPQEALTTQSLNEALTRAGLNAQLTDTEVASLSEPMDNLERRTNEGSPNPDETIRRIGQLEAEIKSKTDAWEAIAAKLRAARDALR